VQTAVREATNGADRAGQPMTGSNVADVQDFLLRSGLCGGESATCRPLSGGVSSDLWRVDLPGRTICVKRALARLRVADEWHAPLSRNAAEYAWLSFAGRHCPANVPRLLAHDADAGLFAMEFVPYPVWKAQLLAGRVDIRVSEAVGDVLGRLHRISSEEPAVAQTFAFDANFDALRIDPYFRVTARRNPHVADRLRELAERTASTRLALVHGDVSPKNILTGPAGPIFLDAECAWFGDPAFDVAFCVNHLTLKTFVRPERTDELRRAASALLSAHEAHIRWEPADEFGERVATLLPALLLARIDGASPVEYLTDTDRRVVRSVAAAMLLSPQVSAMRQWDDIQHMAAQQKAPER
jgi:aminoglycoside phosphotransferase (APT) family kinase protein